MTADNRRELYRIEYPVGLFARFVCGQGLFKIEDIHERSMRFQDSSGRFSLKSLISGEIKFRCGAKQKISGQIVKIRSKAIVVDFDVSVPYHLIVKEQAYLKIGFS